MKLSHSSQELEKGWKGFLPTIPAPVAAAAGVGRRLPALRGLPVRERQVLGQGSSTAAGHGLRGGLGPGSQLARVRDREQGRGTLLPKSARSSREWREVQGHGPETPRQPAHRRGGCVSGRLRAPNSGFLSAWAWAPGSSPRCPARRTALPQSVPKRLNRSARCGKWAALPGPGQPRPLQPWSPRHSPSRAVEQWEAGAGIRGCRHLASPPPIWRARSTPGNWKTRRGEAASQ